MRRPAGVPAPARRCAARLAALLPGVPLAALLLAGALAACRLGPSAEAPDAGLGAAHVSFGYRTLAVTLPEGHGLAEVRLLDAAGALVAAEPVPPGSPITIELPLPWPPGGSPHSTAPSGSAWTLQGATAAGALAERGLVAPARRPPPVSVRLQLPAGLELPLGGAPLVLPIGAEGRLSLSLRNDSARPQALRVTLRLPASLRTEGPAERTVAVRLDLPDATAELTRSLRTRAAPAGDAGSAIAWEIRGGDLTEPLAGTLPVATVDPAAFAQALRIAGSRFPADSLGRIETHRPAERLVLEHPLARRWLGALGLARTADPYQPRGYVRLEVASDLPGAAIVLVRSWVRRAPPPSEGAAASTGGAEAGAAEPAFGPPLLPSRAEIVSLVRVQPGTRDVVQAFYADPARLQPGAYERCTRLEPWGLAASGPAHCAPLRVEASPLGRWLLLWLATGAALAAFAGLVLRSRAWLPGFPLRDRVLIALTFTLALLLVSLPALPLTAVSSVLLGPFEFLAEGLLFKLGLFVLLGALVAWIPRPGVYALFYLMWMAGQALLSGHYGPIVILFAGIPILVMETAWWAIGLTRGGGAAWRKAAVRKTAVQKRARHEAPVLLAALVAGSAEALVVFWDIHLLQALYRQYLAEGFILFQALSAGVYAACGFAIGLPLGRRLRAVRGPDLPADTDRRERAAGPADASAPLLRVAALSYTYPSAVRPALAAVDLDVGAGEIVLLAGPSGCGKTTLLRAIQGILPADGARIALAGVSRAHCTQADWTRRCALLFQEPALQLLRLTPSGEVTLALELSQTSAGQAPASAAREHALARFDLLPLAERPVRLLSGGEVQRTALAALLAGGPRLVLLDEPLAHLDRVQRERLLAALQQLAGQGAGVLIAEHRAELVLPIATRALWMEHGRIVGQGPPAVPALRRSAPALPPPPSRTAASGVASTARGTGADALVELDGVTFRHGEALGKDAPPLFSGVTARLPAGAAIALAGPNGAGKSTLLELIAGLRRPTGGTVRVAGAQPGAWSWAERSRAIGWLPQQAELILCAGTVAEELALPLRAQGVPPEEIEAAVAAWLERLGLSAARTRFPHLLSRGERQRLALGTLLIAQPAVLLLDEPFAGQDPAHAAALGALCRAHLAGALDLAGAPSLAGAAGLAAGPGRAVLVATHDLEPARPWMDGLWRLEEGLLTCELPEQRLAGHPIRAALAGGGA